MERGYVKLWRKIRDSVILQDPFLAQLWVWMITKAAWKSQCVAVPTGRGNTIIKLNPGQLIFGRNAAAKALRCPASSVYDRLKNINKLGMIDIQSGTHYSVITIRNWELYQSEKVERQHPTRQATGTQSSPNRHIEELKHLRKDHDRLSPDVEGIDAERSIPIPPVGKVLREGYSADFEKFWSAYPRKIEKKTAFKKFRAVIKAGASAEDLVLAATNYSVEVAEKDLQYVKHAATFLADDRWRDHLNIAMPGHKPVNLGGLRDAAGNIVRRVRFE